MTIACRATGRARPSPALGQQSIHRGAEEETARASGENNVSNSDLLLSVCLAIRRIL